MGTADLLPLPTNARHGTPIFMPRISEFFGIIIYMYWFDTQKHRKPHFHARFGGLEAVFDLGGHLIEGDLGRRAERLVRDWAKEHKADLKRAWALANTGKELPWIEPLH